MKKDNDRKIKDYKKQQFKKWLIITLLLGVIVLEVLALFNVVNMLWGCGLFIIIYLLKKIL